MARIHRIVRLFAIFSLTSISQAYATDTKFVQYDTVSMNELRQNLTSDQVNQSRLLAYKKLLLLADKLIAQPLLSVVSKTFTPPSGDKHDYLSISRYWWPDPTKSDGLPWIRKDGITNPSTQTDDVDRKRLGVMAKIVRVLSLSYFLSGQDKYAEKAANVLKTWFIVENTKMNPHLEFAQSVPGNPKRRRSGILDGRLIPEFVLDAVHMISSSAHWKKQDTKVINVWLTEYLTWLTQSKLGKQGAKQTNNHGSWYFFQVASLAYYLDKQSLLTDTIEQVKASFEYQFDEHGKQVHELARTRSFFYSCFNLDAITSIASIADKVNLSFWNYESNNGASLDLALNFLLPAAQGGDWPYKTKGIDPLVIAPLLVKFDKQSEHNNYGDILRNIIAQDKQPKLSPSPSAKDMGKNTVLQLALFEPHYLEKK